MPRSRPPTKTDKPTKKHPVGRVSDDTASVELTSYDHIRADKSRSKNISDSIFIAGRERDDNPSAIVNQIFTEITTKYAPDAIQSLTSSVDALSIFQELYELEKNWQNALLSEMFFKGKNFRDYYPIIQLKLMQFTSLKQCALINDNIDDSSNIIYSNMRMKNLYLIEKIILDVREAFDVACADDAERRTFIEELVRRLLPATDQTPKMQPPAAAPELFKERDDRSEKPDAFIRRVYAPWLGKGLLRLHIKKLDLPLYQSLYRWLGSNEMPADLERDLPKAQGRFKDTDIDPALSVLPIAHLTVEQRERRRAYDRERKAASRKKSQKLFTSRP